MKIIGINGSPRKGGNTETCINIVLEAAQADGLETEQINLYDHNIARGCTACGGCRNENAGKCVGVKDDLNPLLEKIYAADGLVVGSPVYFGSATPEIMAVMHRMGYVARGCENNPLAGMVAAGVAVARRAGQNFTHAQLELVFGPLDMVRAGSTYWPIAFGRGTGDVQEDDEGVQTMHTLGKNMARLVKSLNS